LSVGELSERKGSELAMTQLVAWAKSNPDFSIKWNLVGSGPAESSLQQIETPANLNVNFHGFCDPDSIREHYQRNDAMLFPTLCDEWGLVVDESLGSGLPVIGSCHAQSVTTLIKNGHNGFVYDPERNGQLASVLDRIVRMTSDEYGAMPAQARQSIASRTCAASAQQFAHAVSRAIGQRPGSTSNEILENPSVEDRSIGSVDLGRGVVAETGSLVEGTAR
jgi:glycosyltransferase involved in cell wall biosynthesis